VRLRQNETISNANDCYGSIPRFGGGLRLSAMWIPELVLRELWIRLQQRMFPSGEVVLLELTDGLI
jgi:hypothetical protein